ncbi:MAG: trigger factor [Gemmatimonadetes bacterium]|nr:trigger factor [Gemmatimonadota bacterium]MBI2536862.1 trigger factor [Gemmatimonadota bacterium]
MPDIFVTKTREEPGAKAMRVEVPLERVRAAEDKATAYYARRVRLPGFRKGKAPTAVVRKRFQEAIREEVIRELVGEGWKLAVEQEGLKPIADPRVRDLKFEAEKPVTFELLVEVKPDITLGRLGGFQLTRRVLPVRDEMVNDQIEQIRRQRAPWEPLSEPPKAGDYVQITLAIIETDQASEPKRYELVLGEGRALPEVEARIMTLKPGETGDADVQLPQDFPDPAKRGQRRTARITLHEAKRQELPPLDDGFAREVGDFDSLDALRAGARQDLEQEAARQADAEVRRQLIEQIVGANNLEAPRPLVERLLATYAQGYEIPDDQLERFAGEFRPLAEAQVRRDLVLDYVVEKQKLQATEEELDQRVAKIAGRRQADPGQVYASLQKAGRLRELERQITEEKAFAHLLQQSTVTEA